MPNSQSCPPVGVNEVPQVVTAPGTSGPRVGISYDTDFLALMRNQHDDGQPLSRGAYVLLGASNLDACEARLALAESGPSDHVLAWYRDMLQSHVSCVFGQDLADRSTLVETVGPSDSLVTVVGTPVALVRKHRLPNLDVNDKLVKRGLKVSYGGVRALVSRVSRGRCCVKYLDFVGRFTGSSEWLLCESIQVVV